MLIFTASRPAAVSLVLTLPPSVNVIWNNVGGKYLKSLNYKHWQDAAGWEMTTQARARKLPGGFHALVTVPLKMRGDIDNRAKAVFDLLKKQGVIVDDKHLNRLGITRSESQKPGTMTVELWNEEEGT